MGFNGGLNGGFANGIGLNGNGFANGFPNTGAFAANGFEGDPYKNGWLPNKEIAAKWMQYVSNTEVTDSTPPPAPYDIRVQGNKITWKCEADLSERNSSISFAWPFTDGKKCSKKIVAKDSSPSKLMSLSHFAYFSVSYTLYSSSVMSFFSYMTSSTL